MSRRRFDPEELDRPSRDADHSIAELERYAMTADDDAPHGLSDRIMAAIQDEPAPRRGLLAWLVGSSSAGPGPRGFVRAGALAAVIVLAVAGVLFAGQLAHLVPDVGNDGTPTPSVMPSASAVPSVSPAAASTVPSPSATPAGSDDHGGAGSGSTALPTAHETPDGTPGATPEESKTPRPSPTATASPTATPQQGSGG